MKENQDNQDNQNIKIENEFEQPMIEDFDIPEKIRKL